MFSNLVKEMESLWATKMSLASIESTVVYKEFLKSDKILEGLRTIELPTYSIHETGSSSLKDKATHIAGENGWYAGISKHRKLDKNIAALPYPSIVAPLNPEGSFTIAIYKSAQEIFDTPNFNNGVNFKKVGEIKLAFGDVWCPEKDANIYQIIEQAKDTIYLRISGPAYGVYNHTFNASNFEHIHASYAEPNHSSKVFFADTLKHVVNSPAVEAFSEAEITDMENFIFDHAQPPSIIAAETWSYIQAMAAINTDKTQKLLSKYVDIEGPLQKIAAHTIGINNG